MILDPSEVLALFRVLADLDEEDAQRWLPLAAGCARQIAARTRPEVDSNDARESLSLAAAGLLLYRFAASGASGESVRLGELSVTPASSSLEARALRDELIAAAAPYLLPADAFLLQVVPES